MFVAMPMFLAPVLDDLSSFFAASPSFVSSPRSFVSSSPSFVSMEHA